MPKKFPEFHNFGEYLYYAYANLQMLHYALKADKPKYDRMCYMIRAKAFKAYIYHILMCKIGKECIPICFTEVVLWHSDIGI